MRRALVLLLLLYMPLGTAQSTPAMKRPVITLTAGLHIITAELAQNDATRQRGLMHRTALAPNHGMLFVFEHARQQCMWMRNTLIALSVAFIADDGRIVNIEQMQPETQDLHCSNEAVRYALEMPQGWFAERRIAPGASIKGLPRVHQNQQP